MKHNQFTDEQLLDAIQDASDERAIEISTVYDREDVPASTVLSLRTIMRHLPEPEEVSLTEATREALEVFRGIGVGEPGPWVRKAAQLAGAGATQELVEVFARIAASGVIFRDDVRQINKLGVQLATSQDPADGWEQCLFQDIETSDEVVRFEFSDGSSIQGKPHTCTMTDVELWTGYVLTQVTLNAAKKGGARVYRIPAKVQHPDPAEHPVILVSGSLHTGYDEPIPMIWDGGEYYESPRGSLHINSITSWDPATIVPKGGYRP